MTYLYAYLTITLFFFLGSFFYVGYTDANMKDEKAIPLIVTNTLLWPLVVVGFVIWGCIAGIKNYIITFKDHIPR